jgi:hypothetical protein
MQLGMFAIGLIFATALLPRLLPRCIAVTLRDHRITR